MGRRGPKPQPTALKLARGVPGKRALNADEPDLPTPSSRVPPKELTGLARVEWELQVDVLIERGVLTAADMYMFRQYCTMVGEADRWERRIRALGDVKAFERGYPNYLLRLRTRLTQQAAHLGLTPSSRSGVKAVKSTANVADTKRARFFGVRKEKGV